jgi:hypothetical protein
MATLKNETQFEADTISMILLWERGASAEYALKMIRASLDIEKISRAVNKGVAI